MTGSQTAARREHQRALPNLRCLSFDIPTHDLVAEVTQSLRREQPCLDPKFFYDTRGSALFEQITTLPEYYPTRVEADIFERYLPEMAATLGAGDILIEPGSGNCAKARPLIAGTEPAAFVPIDIAGEFLFEAAESIAEDFPAVDVIALAADFTSDWSFAREIPPGRRVIFYPGSTLGNLEPAAARMFLLQLGGVIASDGGVLLGLDLHKDTAILEAAYDDPTGVTAAFNRNALAVINDATGADFNPEAFNHQACYNTDQQRVEMYLVSDRDQTVTLGDAAIALPRGQRIHTESSYKYTRERLDALAASAGFRVAQFWTDPDALFSVSYLTPIDTNT